MLDLESVHVAVLSDCSACRRAVQQAWCICRLALRLTPSGHISCCLSDVCALYTAGEAVHYLNNLQNRVNVTSSGYCLSMAYGTLMGNPVLVVASGIGPVTAALCALELLQCR